MKKLLWSMVLFVAFDSCYASVKGGEFKMSFDVAPTTLNPLSATDGYTSDVKKYVLDNLLKRNLDTYEWEPALAKSWSISKDGKVFEFILRDNVKWHDGKPLTAEDVKFSFDAIVDPTNKYKTAHLKPVYENISEVKILPGNKIQFFVKKLYFDNFSAAATLDVVPAHIYKNPTSEFSKTLNKTMIGSGPYKLDNFDRAKGITLIKNPDWWGKDLDFFKAQYNFEKVSIKFIPDQDVEVQKIEKGDLDYLPMSSEVYFKKTNSNKWGKEIKKVEIKNNSPRGYGFIAFNLKNEIFKNLKVRKAVAHLFNRREMIKKFLFNKSVPATGPLYLQSEYANQEVKPIEYDVKEAIKLLKEEGWELKEGDQFLSKIISGKKTLLSFTILEPMQDFVKYLTIFKEDAKQAGVDVNIKTIEWNSFIKLIDERKFDSVRLAWSGGDIDWDPKQIWHSDSYLNQGSNLGGYSNKLVDQLIDESRMEMDKNLRIKKLKEVYKLIAEDVPYIFMFNNASMYYGVNSKIGKLKDTYKYGAGVTYWWMNK